MFRHKVLTRKPCVYMAYSKVKAELFILYGSIYLQRVRDVQRWVGAGLESQHGDRYGGECLLFRVPAVDRYLII